MSVPQYTTPTFILTFTKDGLDLTQAANVYVTFRSGMNVVTKKGNDLIVQAKSISVHLTQKDTAKFRHGDIEIQANWTTALGDRAASDVVNYKIDKQLLMAVIE